MADVRYWQLESGIPAGTFYIKGAIPYKSENYVITIDTIYPNTEYEFYLNGEQWIVKSDVSGIMYIDVYLERGENELKWRKLGDVTWKWKKLYTTNIGTILAGMAESLEESDNDAIQIKNDFSVMFTTKQEMWNFMYGVGAAVTAEKLEEIVQAMWNWVEKEKAVRQISGVLENVPVTINRIGPMRFGGQWLYNNRYSNGLTGYNIVGGVSVIQTDDTYFGKLLRVTGSAVSINPGIEYGKAGEVGAWLYRTWVRWTGLGSGTVRIGGSINGGVSWIWSSPYTLVGLDFLHIWQGFTQKPTHVAMEMSGTPDFRLDFGWQDLLNEDLNMVLPQVPGKILGRKATAIWSWA